MPHLGVTTVDGSCVIELVRPDMTDAAYIQEVGDEIQRIVGGLEHARVVLDFQKVSRLSSATLGMLIGLSKDIEQNDGQLRLANLQDKLLDIFKMTRLHKVMKIHKSTREAIDSFEKKEKGEEREG